MSEGFKEYCKDCPIEKLLDEKQNTRQSFRSEK